MNRLFIDADAFVAIWDKNDRNHKKALSLIPQIEKSACTLVTSDFAFGEAITVISQNAGKERADKFITYLKASEIEIEGNSELRENGAIQLFKKLASKNTRFTDCLNMVVMREIGIDEIFSFDKHYKKAGFKRFRID